MLISGRRALYTFAVLALLFASDAAQGQPATLVVTEPIKSLEFNDQVTLVGRTEAIKGGRIVSEVAGRVRQINAAEGNFIKRGTPLLTLESERLRLSLQARKAEAEQARVQAELASTTRKRAEDLYAQKLIPESARDSAAVMAISAEERYKQLAAERDMLQYDFDNSVIKAPFDGYTGLQLVRDGEWVAAGTPVFEMIDPSKIKVTVDLPEKYFGHLAVGSEAIVTISGRTEKQVIGKVTGVSPSASESTHTFPVIITVDNKDGHLGGGMLVRATLSLKEKFISLAVSKDAIIRDGSRTTIYTVVDGKASPISVITSSAQGKMIAVQGQGLSEGMPVVVKGNERIYPGASVRLPGENPNGGGDGSRKDQATD